MNWRRNIRGLWAVGCRYRTAMLISCALLGPLVLILTAGVSLSQDAPQGPNQAAEERPLLDQEPFDRITLNDANDNAQVKVLPIPFPDRKVPVAPNPRSKLRVRPMDDVVREYEIYWEDIDRVELYEELLLNEAERLRDAGQLDEAFKHYYAARSRNPELPGLEASIDRYLYLDAVKLTRAEKFHEALATIEELYERKPGFRYSSGARPLIEFIGRLVDRIVGDYIDAQNYRAARQILTRIRETYGDHRKFASLDRWIEQLASMAAEKRDEGREHLDAQRYQEAITAVNKMRQIWPEVEGGRELEEELYDTYPVLQVGVLQPAKTHDAQRMDNWAARRTGRLVRRSLVEFLGPGPEGGRYAFPLGLIERGGNRRQLIFRLNRVAAKGGEGETEPVSGHRIARRLLELADPSSQSYLPAWGGLISTADVQDVLQVNVELRRPHVLPEALLNVPLNPGVSGDKAASPEDGPFELAHSSEKRVQFVNRDFEPGTGLAELVEVTFENAQQAFAALRRGELEVIDRLFPADAVRLQQQSNDSDVAIDRYALPTVHMLLVNTENPFLANRDFRRALAFAIDRETILESELLGGRQVQGCRVISGPFPAPSSGRSPLGYAYNEDIEPRRYTPRLARVLNSVAQQQVKEAAQERGDPKPEFKPLLLGHPAHEAARVAAQAIAAHLSFVGIDCDLKEFPPGVTSDPDKECDLVYAEVAIWEPVADARRLLGERGLAASNDPYLRRSLRRLDEAQNWGEARERLLDVHQTVYSQVAIVPLWQLVDFFAYNKRIRNIGENPVWLYQNVHQWRVASAATDR